MTSKEIVEILDAKLKGQQLLFADDDYVLRNSFYKPTGDKEVDKQILIHWWLNVYFPIWRFGNRLAQDLFVME